jgi:hypothetical protein
VCPRAPAEDEAETDKQSETHRRVRTVTIY